MLGVMNTTQIGWLDEHGRAGAWAAVAETYLFEGKAEDARQHFFKAAEHEERAVECIDAKQRPRTFWIVAVSAVSLWVRANELARAHALATRYLALPSLEPSVKLELEKLLRLCLIVDPRACPKQA